MTPSEFFSTRNPDDKSGQLFADLYDAPPELAEWVNRGVLLVKSISSHQWAIADWMVQGERDLGAKLAYEYGERATGFSRKTLYEWAYVARAVSIRMENLTFGHHQAVASLTPEAQTKCLELAASRNPVMPISDLRDIAYWQPRKLKDVRSPSANLPLQIYKGELDLLEFAARHAGFKDDGNNSAIGQFIRKICVDYFAAHEELREGAAAEYTGEAAAEFKSATEASELGKTREK